MKLFSTKNKNHIVGLKEAVLKGLPDDNGLYMPVKLDPMDPLFFKNIHQFSFQEIAYKVCAHLFEGYIPENKLKEIIENALTFPAPLVYFKEKSVYILELFHGPSYAFKDFGARFMAQLMSYFNEGNEKDLVILVATSGDTGGAVAAGFYKTPGVKVVILYPSGKVSRLQEKQLTTLGENICAIEVNGTFDDCQALVKKAFLDDNLKSKVRLSSANSINIARLIPQMFYYFDAYRQYKILNKNNEKPLVFVVPSGNFGNLTAGLFAKKLGLPVSFFGAATNINNIVPEFLETGKYNPKPSLPTLSNAMDVGKPSNFDRIASLYGGSNEICSTWNNMKDDIRGAWFNDSETVLKMREFSSGADYFLDPHTAVGLLAADKFKNEFGEGNDYVVLSTAHSVKFLEEVKGVYKVNDRYSVPNDYIELMKRSKDSTLMDADFLKFKDYLLAMFGE